MKQLQYKYSVDTKTFEACNMFIANAKFDYALGQMKAKDTFIILFVNLSHNYFFSAASDCAIVAIVKHQSKTKKKFIYMTR